VAIAFCLGRTYALTLLYNLNARKKLRENSSRSSIATARKWSQNRKTGQPVEAMDLGAISIVRSVHVDREEQEDTQKSGGLFSVGIIVF
jgi:hypothetical protein